MARFGDPVAVTVNSGQRASEQFQLFGGPDRLTVITGSRSNATAVFFSVAAQSGGPFARTTIPGGTGTAYLVAASAQGVVAGLVHPVPPGMFGRVEVNSGPTAPETYSLVGGVTR
jgi:hypothetical protein